MARTVAGVDPRAKVRILARLQSIEGHWRAIVRMVDEDRYCIDVIKQIGAVQSAVDKATALLLERHLSHCVTDAIRSDNTRQRERAIAELLDVFEHGRHYARPNGGGGTA
ncbi:MAG TPA: metal-sensitive transcriptional regulator [bacterium]|nr:metal-sensitive transcriptional regulator [bacterium]